MYIYHIVFIHSSANVFPCLGYYAAVFHRTNVPQKPFWGITGQTYLPSGDKGFFSQNISETTFGKFCSMQ